MSGIINNLGAVSGVMGSTVGTPAATTAANLGAGALPVGVTGGSGLTLQNTPQFMVRMASSQTHAHDCQCLVNFDTVVYETNAGSWVTATDRWIPAVVGKYVIGIGLHWSNGNANLRQGIVYLRLNGSTVSAVDATPDENFGTRDYREMSQIIDITATSDYLEAYSQLYNSGDSTGTWTVAGAGTVGSHMWGYRIGDDT